MLDSFFVENFRLFRRLEMARLGQVNLLVGKNNSGKSALLEAIELYASNASIRTLLSLILGREEEWNERNQSGNQQMYDSPIRHLFRGHHFPALVESGIMLGAGNKSSQQFHLRITVYQAEIDEEGEVRRKPLTLGEAITLEDEVEFWLTVIDENGIRRLIQSDKNFSFSRVRVPSSEREPKYPCQIVPTRNMTAHKIASLWDITGLSDAATEVIAGLQIIAPSIVGIGFVEAASSSRIARVPLVRTKDASEPLPLKSMGDGMTRLFHLIVALVNAKDGILLIDEFENGLHWSVQPAVWKTIFRLATDLNVQVFATTHSRDCVSSFEEAWKEHPDAGAFFRLQLNSDGDAIAKSYALETLADSLDTDVEVR